MCSLVWRSRVGQGVHFPSVSRKRVMDKINKAKEVTEKCLGGCELGRDFAPGHRQHQISVFILKVLKADIHLEELLLIRGISKETVERFRDLKFDGFG